MFEIGDYVSYRAEGVCVISDIRIESFDSRRESEEYYILSPIKEPNSVLYVPKSNQTLMNMMHPLLSAEELCLLADELREERMEWKSESRARNYSFKDVLNSGDRRSLILLVNTITEQTAALAEKSKKLTAGDEAVFKRAKKMLFDEFSVTADIENEEMLMQVLQGKLRCRARA